jgi:uncharacterized protein DUF1559
MTRTVRLIAAATLLTGLVAAGCSKKSDDGSDGGPPNPTGMNDRAAKEEALKRLRQIGKALHEHHDALGVFPAGVVGPKGELGLSWRVAILPYLDEEGLYKEFRLKEPWDSEHNKKLVTKMPKVFESPGKSAPEGKTYLRSFAGQSGFIMLPYQGPVPKGKAPPPPFPHLQPGFFAPGQRMVGILDGTSNTLMVVEAAEPVEWTKPDDLPSPGFPGAPDQPPTPKLGGPFAGGFHGLMCDGAAHFFPDTLGEKTLRAMITTNGGEVLPEEATKILFPPDPKKAAIPTEVPSDLPDAAARRTAVGNYFAIHKAIDAFDQTTGHIPAGISAKKTLGLSWRVQLLPYLGQEALFKEFKLNEPWDSEHNRKLIDRMPKVFESPGKAAPKGHTFIRTTEGQAAILRTGPDGKVQARQEDGAPAYGIRLIAGIPDGTTNTILFFEAEESVPWTKPGDVPFAGTGTPILGKGGRYELPKTAKIPKLGGPFADGFHAVMADGQVTFYKTGFPEAELAKLLCPNDGWVVDQFLDPSKILYSIPPPVPPKKPSSPIKESGKSKEYGKPPSR